MGYISVVDCVCLYQCVFDVVSCESWQSRENHKNTRYMGSRSFKVIEFGTNRTGIGLYDFLLG